MRSLSPTPPAGRLTPTLTRRRHVDLMRMCSAVCTAA
ncbi:putative leader peptide [Micromonospora sp. NPDC049275]